MRSHQLTPLLNYNPKLSGSAIQIFLLVAESRNGIIQAVVTRTLKRAKSTISRQVAILSDTTQKHFPGMNLIERNDVKVGQQWCSHLSLTSKGEEIYSLMTTKL